MTKTLSPFAQRVYALTKRIPKGKVSTYKLLARQLGTRSYRAVGQALRCNPYAPLVPCHRVVATSGLLNGFNGSRSQQELNRKTKLLQSEGVSIKHNAIVNFDRVLFTF